MAGPDRATAPSPDRALIDALFLRSPFSVALYDREGRVAAANPAYEQHWGIRLEDVPDSFSLFTDPQLIAAGLMPLLRRAYDGEPVVLPPVRYDSAIATGAGGHVVWTQGHCFPVRAPDGRVTHVAIMHADVTAIVQAQTAMSTLDRQLDAERDALVRIIMQLPVALAVLQGPELRIRAVSDAYRRIVMGRELIGQPIRQALADLTAVDPDRDMFADLDRVYGTGVPVVGTNLHARWDADGDGEPEEHYIDVIYAPLYGAPHDDAPPAVEGVTMLIQEVSERARAERALRESEKRFRNMANAAPVMLWMTDADGWCTFLNRQWLEFTGQSLEEGLGSGWLSCVHPDDMTNVERAFRESNAQQMPYRVDLRLRRADGVYRWAVDSAAPRWGPGGEYLGYIGSAVDIEERTILLESERTMRRRTELLQRATSALSGALTLEEVARIVLLQAADALGARAGAIVLRSPDGALELLSGMGLDVEETRAWVRVPADADVPAAHALRSGACVMVRSRTELRERFPQLADTPASQQYPALVSMPLQVGGQSLGALTLLWPTTRALDDAGEFALLESLATQAALALERARLHHAEREAHAVAERAVERARRLQQLTTALNRAATREQVADVVFSEGMEAVGADAGSLALVLTDGAGRADALQTVRSMGYDDDWAAATAHIPVQAGRPLSHAVLHRQMVLVSSPQEWRSSFPAVTVDLAAIGFGAFAALPVMVADRVVAVLSFSFRESREFDEGLRTFLATLAEQCALALERQRLHDLEVRQSAQHAALLETIEDAFIALDREQRFLYLNRQGEALLGRPAAELLGNRFDAVLPAAVGLPLHAAIVGVLQTKDSTQLEVFNAAAHRWIDARVYPAPDGVSLVCQDVTARKRAQGAAAFLSEASRLLSASLDYQATLRAVADAAVPRLGDWCAVTIIDDPLSRQWPPRVERVAVVHRDPAKLELGAELERRYPTDWAQESGMALVLRDGVPLFLPVVTEEMLRANARDEEHLRLLLALRITSILVVPLVARDLTLGALTLCMTDSGRHFDESDLLLVEDLAKRAAIAVDNARLFREAERARAEAETANVAKSQFLATMSHELRTPLNAIQGHVQLLDLGIHGPVNAAQHDALRRIERAERHLLGLIDDVLNFARVEAGQAEYHVREVVVADVLSDILPMIERQYSEKGVALSVHLPERTPEGPTGRPLIRVCADHDKLGQILLNLLSNAVKFTPAGGQVRVELEAEDGAEVAELRVRDTGIGIPPDQLEAVFQPFVQVRSPHGAGPGGTGLGLSISRDMAQGMGGDLTVRSAPGHGSCFTLSLKRPRGSAITSLG